MLQQAVTVHYQDGHTEQATLTQYELGQFDRWALKAGFAPQRGQHVVEAMPIVWMRYGAWCAIFRNVKDGKPSFDAWDATVVEVSPDDEESQPDPTQQGTPGAPSSE